MQQGQLTEQEAEQEVQKALARAMALEALSREAARVSQRLQEMEREAGGSLAVLEMEVGGCWEARACCHPTCIR